MQHIAIVNKSWKITPKLISGSKTIESRWYKNKSSPWNKINKGEIIYFKESGGQVKIKAIVKKVVQFKILNDENLKDLIRRYSGVGFINFDRTPEKVYDWAMKKKYVILIFLDNIEEIKPFNITKRGFGNACAWMVIDDIENFKLSEI